jgi:copper chaperone CopZ
MKYFTIFLFSFFTATTVANAASADTLKIKIQTNCDHCKTCETCWGRIEQNMIFTKGVKYLDYDEQAMVITVGFNAKKVTPDKLREVVSKTGFDADNVKADAAAQEKLDECCKRRD